MLDLGVAAWVVQVVGVEEDDGEACFVGSYNIGFVGVPDVEGV